MHTADLSAKREGPGVSCQKNQKGSVPTEKSFDPSFRKSNSHRRSLGKKGDGGEF